MFKDAKNTDTMFKAAEFLNTDVAMNTIFENTQAGCRDVPDSSPPSIVKPSWAGLLLQLGRRSDGMVVAGPLPITRHS
ncbi:MAG: hypothetical protein R2838_17210 [Caldilineaceae bacterium]